MLTRMRQPQPLLPRGLSGKMRATRASWTPSVRATWWVATVREVPCAKPWAGRLKGTPPTMSGV